jgi:general secretion pathway protein G
MMRVQKNIPKPTNGGNNRGFSVIELLVAIGIIALLSTIGVISMLRAREIARINKASADIANIATAIQLLGEDVGKWPSGCPIESGADVELNILTAQAALVSRPTVGDFGNGCFWSASDIAKWNGPYLGQVTDPWGHNYYFDSDYRPYLNCASEDTLNGHAYVVSFGPNGVGVNAYDCDDIFKALP